MGHRFRPTLLFPLDHAWFVFQEVDERSAHVGGSAAAIRTLLAALPNTAEASPDDLLDLS